MSELLSAASDTLLFKIAVGTYEDFISSEVAIETLFAMEANEDEIKEVYRLLYRRYKHWEISVVNIDDFLDMLWEKIEIHTPNYFERKKRYKQLLNMSDSELLLQAKTISNFVDHTDDKVEGDPLEKVLTNVSNQTASKSFGNLSSSLRGQIRAAQETLIDNFLDKFKKLFLLLTTKSEYI